jgi:Na+/H+ antiporter NhaD/arsenite permease-like protein
VLFAIPIDYRDFVRLAIFALTYLIVGIGKFPRLRLDRTGAALVGAAAMVLAGGISQHEALAAIDFSTLTLLFGMMIVVAGLRLSGALTAIARFALQRAHSGFGLLATIIAAAGVLAAFFINDVVCLALAPLLLESTRQLEVDPEPYLIGLATASNIGSAATITGNPQNMIVAGYAHLSYGAFASRLAPIALAGLLVDYAVIALLYRTQLGSLPGSEGKSVAKKGAPLAPMIRPAVIAFGVLAGFVMGFPTHLVALGAGAFALLTRRIPPLEVYRLIDWTLLLLFASLFIVVAGAEKTGFQNFVVNLVSVARLKNPVILTALIAILSNLVSNVPAVIVFQPIYERMGDGMGSALLIAASSTFAGNLTILGSIANLIVVETAASQGVTISFYRYFRAGLPITIVTLCLAVLLLHLEPGR